MIIVKTKEQIEKMKVAGRITGEAILVAAEMIKEGVTTKQIDDKIRHFFEKHGAKPSFLGYGGFPGSACISINNEIIHGIPSADRVLKEGDPRRQREYVPGGQDLCGGTAAHRRHQGELLSRRGGNRH